MIVSIQIYFISFGLGFHRKDRRDIVIFWANLLMNIVNISFQIGITAMQVYRKSAASKLTIHSLFRAPSLMALSLENALAQNIYMLMLPGMFFTGFLMMPIMAGVVPYFWNMFLMKVILYRVSILYIAQYYTMHIMFNTQYYSSIIMSGGGSRSSSSGTACPSACCGSWAHFIVLVYTKILYLYICVFIVFHHLVFYRAHPPLGAGVAREVPLEERGAGPRGYVYIYIYIYIYTYLYIYI